MSAFSPVTAATEGFRVMRREPKAVAVWTLLWAVALVVISVLKPKIGADVFSRGQVNWTWSLILQSFGSYAAIFILILLAVWVMTTTAVFRSVLRPDERSWFFLRVGLDELRNALFTAIAFVVVPFVGAVLAGALFLMFTPLLATQTPVTRYVAVIGSLLTGCLGAWLGVRLSLIAVETFAERRFHLTAYWPLARGRFWRVLASYSIIVSQMIVATGAIALLGFLILNAFFSVQRLPANLDLFRRALIFAIAGAEAVLGGAVFMLPSILIGACQAYVFRALADSSPTVYGMSWAPDPKAHPQG